MKLKFNGTNLEEHHQFINCYEKTDATGWKLIVCDKFYLKSTFINSFILLLQDPQICNEQLFLQNAFLRLLSFYDNP